MPAQLIIFLLLFGGLQGVLFSLFLIRRKLHRSSYIFLLLYLGTMLLQITLKIMNKMWLMDNWSFFYSFSHYLPLLYGPLAYFFVKHFLHHGTFRIKELLHFIPILFISFALFICESFQAPSALVFLCYNPVLRLIILSGILVIYHLLAFQTWRLHVTTVKNYYSDTRLVKLNWIKQFILISAISCLAVVFALFALYVNYPRGHEYRYGFVVLSFVIYWFSYIALTKPSVFSVIKGYAAQNAEKLSAAPQLSVYRAVTKYSNSGMSVDQVKKICFNLEKLMVAEKLYLQPDLTISHLAERLNCSRHHLSQVLNEKLNKSYYDYINLLRIEEAKQLLKERSYQNHKIASIAYDAGFNSLSTFNDVFKKITGQTPSAYRKLSLNFSHRQRV